MATDTFIDKTISHFHILEKLGEGGMGRVYKARDILLQRFVALKFISPHLLQNPGALQRFQTEAIAASTINHPHICTIYEIDIDSTTPFIAMELIEGVSLAHYIKTKQALPENDLYAITKQLCDALGHSHARGIIHRDIKPENILLTSDGRVKITDFGLAKLANVADVVDTIGSDDRASLLHSATMHSSMFGTASYMSPEQIRNEPIDHRSDIFALGIVMYEMATGSNPFHADTLTDTLENILYDEIVFQKKLSKTCQAIILKAVHKNPRKRFQNVDELVQDILAFEQQKKQRQKLLKTLVPAIIAIVLTAAVIIKFMPADQNRPAFFTSAQTTPMTNWEGLETEPVFSPDGSEFAFVADQSGYSDVWIKNIAANEFTNLTRTHKLQAKSPAWSPNGEELFFSGTASRGALYSIQKDGGALTPLLDYGKQPACSPDGFKIAFIDIGEQNILCLDRESGTVDTLFHNAGDGFVHRPSWSTTGDSLAFALGTSQKWQILIKDLTADKISHVTQDSTLNYGPIWAPNFRGLFYRSTKNGVQDIWLHRLNDKEPPVQITVSAEAQHFDVSRDGHSIIYSRVEPRGEIYSVALDEPAPIAKQITYLNHKSIGSALSADNRFLYFISNAYGSYDVWRCRKDGTMIERLVSQPFHQWSPKPHPHLPLVLYDGGFGTTSELYLYNMQTLENSRLTFNDVSDNLADWSPDGERILVTRRNPGADLFELSRTGEMIRRVTTHAASDIGGCYSPCGTKIAFVSERDGLHNVWLFDGVQSEPRQLTFEKERTGLLITWSPDGRFIYYSAMRQGVRNICQISIDGGEPRQVTFFNSPVKQVHRSTQLACDGGSLFFSLSEFTGDIWMIEAQD